MLRIILLIIAGSACQLADNESDSKFVAFIQQDRGSDRGYKFLIKMVHKSAWRIGLGFADNNNCANSFSPRQKNELQAGISEALNVWLGSLSDKANIVNTFDYVWLTSYTLYPPLISGHDIYLLRDSDNFDLEFVVRCEVGRSFAFRRGSRVSVINLFRERRRPTTNAAITSVQRYSKVILLHELGHAFGLGDTYVDQGNVFRYGRSDGGSRYTTGEQPLAIMNAIYLVSAAYRNQYKLAEDDIAGIRWLYRYYLEKNLSIRNCPSDFVYEDNTKGCRPRYPLIFAVKQGNLATVTSLLRDDSSIDHGQKDNLGNTALHHAAKRVRGHGTALYFFLRERFSEQHQSIRNLVGQTAGDIYASGLWAGYFLLGTNSFLDDKRTDSALSMLEEALDTGYPGTIRRLTAESLNVRDNSYKNGLLHRAVTGDNTAIIDQLLGHPLIKVNISNDNGDRALHKMALLDRKALLKKILARQDLLINSQNNNGDSALHVAARAGHVDLIKLLLADDRIDITIANNHSKTARDVAEEKKEASLRRGDYQKIMELIDAHDE